MENTQESKEKEWTLPAGSMIKIGDTPYWLKSETVVMGCREPELFPKEGQALYTAQSS